MRPVRGFTLIELMIVVAIVAILAAVAIPAYQQYVARAQVTDGIALATGAKTAVWDFYADKGTMPSNNQSIGLATPASIKSNYASSLTVVTGKITVAYGGGRLNSALVNSTISLSPVTTGGSIIWTCKGANLPNRYLPTPCRS